MLLNDEIYCESRFSTVSPVVVYLQRHQPLVITVEWVKFYTQNQLSYETKFDENTAYNVKSKSNLKMDSIDFKKMVQKDPKLKKISDDISDIFDKNSEKRLKNILL